MQLQGRQVSTRLFKRQLLRAKVVKEAPPRPEPKKSSPYSRYRGVSIYGRHVAHIGKTNDSKSIIFEDIIARLTLHGLLFSTNTAIDSGNQSYKLQFHPSDTLIIPRFVRQYLPTPKPLHEDPKNWKPVHILHGDPQLFLRELYLYWDTVRRTPIAMIQSGLVGKRGLKRLNENLLTPDPTLKDAWSENQTKHLYQLRLILQALSLLDVRYKKLQVVNRNGRSIPEFWQKTTAEQIKAILTIWRALNQPIYLETSHYSVNSDTQSATQHLLTILAKIPTSSWIDAATLLDMLQDQNENFLIGSRSYIESRRNYYYDDREEVIVIMDKMEREFVAQAMSDFLFQMGLVELGFDAVSTNPANWDVFKLTPLGTAVFKNQPATTPPDSGQIIIQPNFQILAMGPVPLNLLAKLDLFAQRQKIDRSAFEYHLSRKSVYAAQQMGYSVANVEQFLTAVTPNGLAQNIRRSLSEWSAHHERIVFRSNITLLQAADETVLERLLNDAQTGKLLTRPTGNVVALVKNHSQSRLVQALQNMNILPAISGASPEAADKSVIVHKNGRIQPVHAVPSFHLRGRMAKFSEEAGDGWQLTETAVRRAGGSKKKAQAIVDELRKLHRGRLPKSIVMQIKAWGGYYGTATIGTITLFEFRNLETLAELSKLADLKELLHPFPAGKRALAVVDEEQITAVKTILNRLGIKITPLP